MKIKEFLDEKNQITTLGIKWYLGDKNSTSGIKIVPQGEKKEYLHPLFKGAFMWEYKHVSRLHYRDALL